MNTKQALQLARESVPHMNQVAGGLYEIRWLDGRDEFATPPAKRLTVRRWRQEMILEHAARTVGSMEAMNRDARDCMTRLEMTSFWVLLKRERRIKAGKCQVEKDLVARSLTQSMRWHATRRATLERERIEKACPPPPDAAQAVATAKARITARHPQLPPPTVERLAAWVAGTL